jgi:hypothetical protein
MSLYDTFQENFLIVKLLFDHELFIIIIIIIAVIYELCFFAHNIIVVMHLFFIDLKYGIIYN